MQKHNILLGNPESCASCGFYLTQTIPQNSRTDRAHPLMATAPLNDTGPPQQDLHHTTKAAQELLQGRDKELYLSTWPHNSPDTNLIRDPWGVPEN